MVAVGRLPVARGNELWALKKLNASEIGLLQVGAIDKNLEKIAALKVRAFETGAVEIGPAEIGVLGEWEKQLLHMAERSGNANFLCLAVQNIIKAPEVSQLSQNEYDRGFNDDK